MESARRVPCSSLGTWPSRTLRKSRPTALALRLRRSERRLQARAAFGVGTKVTAPWFASPDLAQCTTTLRRFALFLQLARTLCICSALRLSIFGLAELGFSNSPGAFPLRSSRGRGIAPPLQHFDCGDRTKRRRPPSSRKPEICYRYRFWIVCHTTREA